MSRKRPAGPTRAISGEEIQHLASLARLSVARSDEERLREQLTEVLEYFAVIDEAVANAAQAVVVWVRQGIEACMNQYNA